MKTITLTVQINTENETEAYRAAMEIEKAIENNTNFTRVIAEATSETEAEIEA